MVLLRSGSMLSTVKMKKGNDMIDFDAKITTESLKEFIENVTQD